MSSLPSAKSKKSVKKTPTSEFVYQKPEKVKKINKKGICIRNVANWAAVKLWHRFDNKQFNPDRLREELPNISPKVQSLLQNIKKLDLKDQREFGHKFKHFIFTDVKGNHGIKTVASSMISHGYNLTIEPNANKTKLRLQVHEETIRPEGSNNFAILTATPVFALNIREDIKRQIVGGDGVFNSRPDNVHGQKIRFVLGDSGFKEGVDLFDVKYVHILEPQLTRADLTQAVGRATRTCGQKGLQFVPNKGWTLEVFEYDIRVPNGSVTRGSFTKSPKKEVLLSDKVFELGGIDLSELETVSDLYRLMQISAVDRELNHPINLFGKSEEEKEAFYNELPHLRPKSKK